MPIGVSVEAFLKLANRNSMHGTVIRNEINAGLPIFRIRTQKLAVH